MPQAFEYPTSENHPNYEAIETAYQKEKYRRNKMISRNWKYYLGDQDKQLAPQQDGYDDNVTVNKIELIAQRATSFLLGDGVYFEAPGDEDATSILNMLWADSKGKVLLDEIALDGEVTGHNVIRVEPYNDTLRLRRVRPRHFTAFWDAFDVSRVLWYRLEHKIDQTGRRVDYVKGSYDSETGRMNTGNEVWTEFSFNYMGKLGKWKLDTVTEWEFDFPPIFDWPNRTDGAEYYGRPGIGMAMRLNDYLNFTLSNIQRTLKIYTAPRTIGTGFSSNDLIPTEAGSFFTVPDKDAKIYNLEMQSDLQAARAFADMLNEEIWQSSGLTDPSTVKDRIGQLTNFGLRVLFTDTVNRTERKRALWTEALDTLNRRLLILLGVEPPEKTVVIWPNILPDNAESETQQIIDLVDRQLISATTALERLEFDYDTEAERKAIEQAELGNAGAQALAQMVQSNAGFNR